MDISISRRWVLLHYQLSSQPTATRVYVWRRLKRLGAIFWNDAVWVLPDTPRTREQFQWLAAEIVEMGGEASLWEARQLQIEQEESLVRQFSAQVDTAYRRVLASLQARKPDPVRLSQQFQQAAQSDYFGSELGQHVRAALIAARGAKRGGKRT